MLYNKNMEKQIGFSELEYSLKRKKTRKEIFLEKMEEVIPLKLFCDCIEPYYYVKGNGREPTPLNIMVRMYLISQWYNLSDEACEDLIWENQTVRQYVGIDLGQSGAPDATTLCKFRGLLVKHGLNEKIFEELKRRFEEKKIIFKEGAIVDATIIEAPESKTNKEHKHVDSEMSCMRKNNRYYHGCKANIAVDVRSGLVKSLSVTTAAVHDIEAAASVLSGEEKEVYGDAGYTGIEHRVDICEKFKDKENPEKTTYYSHKKGKLVLDKIRKETSFIINRKRAEIRKKSVAEQEKLRAEESEKFKIRAKVEHPFRVVKHVFGFRKTRLRGLNKNLNKLYMLFALSNIYLYFVMQKNKKSIKK